MATDEKLLQVIKDTRIKYATTRGDGWNSAFDIIFTRTKSKCREIVLRYREENPEAAPHIENISNQILSNIVQLKNESDTEDFKNRIRLDILDEIALEVEKLNPSEEKKKSKKKQDKKGELEK